MAKVKKSESSEKVSGEKHSIPVMGERRAPRRTSLIDRHRREVKVTKTAVKDAERPVIEIPEDVQAKFVEFACAKEVFDLVEEEKKVRQKEVSSEIYERFLDVLWRSKCQPVNPSIKAMSSGKLDATGQFIVSAGSKIKVNMPEPREEEDPADALVRGLVAAGVSPENAERLVAEEVSLVPSWSLNFTDMIRGEVVEGKIASPTETQRDAAETLFCAIHGEDRDGNEIGDEERLELLATIGRSGWEALRTDIKKRIKYFPILANSKDFLDRVCDYADTREEMSAILSVFVPLYYPQRVTFAPSDTEASKKSRMVADAKTMIG
ncbi:MAG: hypothetical protein EBX52_12550 [Proteobacteria bacterium]|nr:hypothetical protein [Pseudomonadota bacterium]